jgi:hypothetical protein
MENNVMNFHSKNTVLNFINEVSSEDEIELRVCSGVCWFTYEVKLAINTPTRANPLIISTIISLFFCSVGIIDVMLVGIIAGWTSGHPRFTPGTRPECSGRQAG